MPRGSVLGRLPIDWCASDLRGLLVTYLAWQDPTCAPPVHTCPLIAVFVGHLFVPSNERLLWVKDRFLMKLLCTFVIAASRACYQSCTAITIRRIVRRSMSWPICCGLNFIRYRNSRWSECGGECKP